MLKPPKKPIWKRMWFILIVGLVILVAFSSTPKEEQPTTSPPTQSAAPQPPPATSPAPTPQPQQPLAPPAVLPQPVAPAPAPQPTPAPRSPTPIPTPPDTATAVNRATVARVVDGDTIEVRLGTGTMALVRLIGVNTPESTTQQESFGKEAAAFTETRLLGRVVYLESDVSDKDRFGRLLRYVWLATPAATEQATRDNLFNAILLLEGFAQVATFPPNVKYVDYFTRFQTEAREANRGLWTTAVSPAADKVDINTATIEELKRIIHIDQVRAEEIVRLRPFSSVDDLDRVRGIGPARLADIKEQGIASVK